MKWFDSFRASPEEVQASRDLDLIKVNLPRLTRPNLVARLYMLFTAMGTVGISWGIPTSATAKILASGGWTANAIIATMMIAVVMGLLDVIVNDGFVLQSIFRADGWICRFAAWLEGRRAQRCFVIGGCYLILTLAGSGSAVNGTFWLLLYFMQLSLCAGLLAWGLRALAHATVIGGRDATA